EGGHVSPCRLGPLLHLFGFGRPSGRHVCGRRHRLPQRTLALYLADVLVGTTRGAVAVVDRPAAGGGDGTVVRLAGVGGAGLQAPQGGRLGLEQDTHGGPRSGGAVVAGAGGGQPVGGGGGCRGGGLGGRASRAAAVGAGLARDAVGGGGTPGTGAAALGKA